MSDIRLCMELVGSRILMADVVAELGNAYKTAGEDKDVTHECVSYVIEHMRRECAMRGEPYLAYKVDGVGVLTFTPEQTDDGDEKRTKQDTPSV